MCGVAYIRAINTPAHFKQLTQEAKDLFIDPDSNRFVIEILTKQDPNQEVKPGPGFTVPMTEFVQRVMLNLGKKEFIECKVDFDLKDKSTVIHDIVTEITIKDGIVTKIEKPNMKYAYGD